MVWVKNSKTHFFSGTPCISYFRKRFSQPSRLGKQRQHLVNSYLFLYGCRRFCDELVPTFHICCQVPFFLGTRLHFIQNASPTYVQSFVTIIQHQCLCKQNIFTKLTTLCKHSLYRPPYLVAITEHNLCDPPWYQATFKNGQSIKIVTWYQKTSLIALAITLAAPLAKNQILQNKSGFHTFAWFAHWHTVGNVCTSTLFCWNLYFLF